jgi:hypothetical protein
MTSMTPLLEDRRRLVVVASAALAASMCSGGAMSSSTTSPSATTSTTTTTATASLPSAYSRFYGAATVTLEGTTVVIRTTDLPDHKSPYYGAGNSGYEAPQAGMQVNPNRISTQNIVFRIPASPAAATPSDTPLGSIGVAVNGVVLFNQYAAGRTPLTTEILSFDQYNGHPNQTNTYHYHVEPVWLTAARGKSSLIGVLLDGFPVYGTLDESGSAPSALDSCNGHTHATTDYPQGIYHYHVTSGPPYISGCFHGAPGTVAG